MKGETRRLRAELSPEELEALREGLLGDLAAIPSLQVRIKNAQKEAELLALGYRDLPFGVVRGRSGEGAVERLVEVEDLKDQVKQARQRIAAAVARVARGWEVRDVWVDRTLEGLDAVAVRTDTGEEIERRPATKEELEEEEG